MSEVLIVIPARYASTRLPGKPLADLGGRPLIGRVLERLSQLEDVPAVVATDDERIARTVEDLGGQAVMTSSRCRSGTDRVAEVMAGRSERWVINVQGDEPFLEVGSIRSLIGALREDAGLEMVTLACPLAEEARWRDPGVVKVVTDARGFALYFSRAPIPWPRDVTGVPAGALQHLGVYGYRVDTLLRLAELPPAPLEGLEQLEQLRALTHGIRIKVLPARGAWLGIDTPVDLEEARARLAGLQGRTQSGLMSPDDSIF